MFTKPFVLVLAAIIVSALSASVQAEPILIDFNSTGSTPTLGGTWNVISAPSATPQSLVDSAGDSTSATLATGGGDLGDSSLTNPGWTKSWVDSKAVSDYFYLHGTQSDTIIFGGLNNNLRYDVELVSSRSTSTSADRDIMDITVQGAYTSSEASSDNFNCHTDGYVGQKILIWNNVAPSDHEITMAFDMDNTGYAFVNAARLTAQFTVVPEPMSMTLCLSGLVLCGLARCRRRNNAFLRSKHRA